MATGLKDKNDDVYDRPGHAQSQTPTNDDLRNITGISPEEERGMEARAKKSAGTEDVAAAEKNPEESSQATEADSREARSLGRTDKAAAVQRRSGGFWKGGKGDKKKKGLWRSLSGRKKTGVGAVVGVVLTGFVAIFSFLPSLKFPHIENALGKFPRLQSLAADARIHGFMRTTRASRSGDVGETRVGFLGSVSFRRLMDRLETEYGVTLTRRTGTTGRPTHLRIDPPENSPLRVLNNDGTTDNERTIRNIRRALNLPDDRTLGRVGDTTGRGGTYRMDLSGLNSRALRRIMDGVLEIDKAHATGFKGKTATYMRKRNIAKFWRAPSLFHPMTRKVADFREGYDSWSDRRARNRERKGRTNKRAQLAVKWENAKTKVRDQIGPNKLRAAGALLSFTDGLCLLKEVSEVLPAAQYAAVVQPAMEEAIDMEAVSSQQRSSQDFTGPMLDAAVEGLSDPEGRDVLQARSMNALTDGGGGHGQDIDPGTKQAFTLRGSSIEELAATLFAGIPELQSVAAGGDDFADIACSGLGYGVQIAVGGALTVLLPGGAVAKSVQIGRSAVISSIIINLVKDFIGDDVAAAAENACGLDSEGNTVNAEKLGNCAAYGARASSNTTNFTMGGTELSETDETAWLMELEAQEQLEFQQKPLFARLFDVRETRSLTARAVASINPGPVLSTLSNLTSNALSAIIRIPATTLSTLSAKANAQVVTYDWGFPLAGVPYWIIEDPRYEDPFENARVAAEIFEGGNGNDMIEKAKECFGVEISNPNDRWQAEAVEEIVPMTDEYIEADCNDLSDSNWIRTMMFVFDDSIVSAIACYEGGDNVINICEEMGFSGEAVAE